MKALYILFIVLIFAGCTMKPEGNVNFPPAITGDAVLDTNGEVNIPDSSNEISTTLTSTSQTTTTTIDEAIIQIKEGDLLKLDLKASDPDNNPIIYTFSSPLDNQGQWQTEIGDAGEYNVIVTASDGDLSITKNLKIIVESVNSAPVINNYDDIKEISVFEGDTITINPDISDVENDDITVSYSGFMTKDTYKTTFTDAGNHKVIISVDDGYNKIEESISIIVKNKDRAPSLSAIDDIKVTEGDLIMVKAVANDPDGDTVKLSFGSPLDSNGEWQTIVGDAGEYNTKVSATAGELTESVSVKIFVASKNRAPVIEDIAPIYVNEGQTVLIKPVVSDPDGDNIYLSYSGWMTNDIYQTTYDDAGTHTVIVRANDGVAESTKDVTVVVADQNRPPTDLEIGVIVVPGGN